jgi:hypothetical protein
MSERYQFDAKDHALLRAAATLLKKVAIAEGTKPAQLVSVAKLQHVLSLLPRATSEIDVTVSVSSPRRDFPDEIETMHRWEVAVEGQRLSISSGGHFFRPSTGGDSFTTMNWAVIPEEASELSDYIESLWMVPDVLTFPDGVASIDFASGGYTVEVTDEDNPLLEDNEDAVEEEFGDESDTQSTSDLPGMDLTKEEPIRVDVDLKSRSLATNSPGRICFERIVQGAIFTKKGAMDFTGVPTSRLNSWMTKRLIHLRAESDPGSVPPNWSLYELLQVKILDLFCYQATTSPESVAPAASVAAGVIVTDVLGFGVFVDNPDAGYMPDFGRGRFVISGPSDPMVTPDDTTLLDIHRELVSTTWTALDMNLLAGGITVPAIKMFLDQVKTMHDFHFTDPNRFHREIMEGFNTRTYYAFRKLADSVGHNIN